MTILGESLNSSRTTREISGGSNQDNGIFQKIGKEEKYICLNSKCEYTFNILSGINPEAIEENKRKEEEIRIMINNLKNAKSSAPEKKEFNFQQEGRLKQKIRSKFRFKKI